MNSRQPAHLVDVRLDADDVVGADRLRLAAISPSACSRAS